MRNRGLLMGLVALALLGFAATAWAQVSTPTDKPEEKTVVVKGEGVIFQGDQALAKEKAVERALRAAVEQVVGIFVKSSTLVQNYITVDDKILSQSKGYVKTWRELSSKVEDNVVVVEIEATVAAAKVQASLDQIQWAQAKMNYPRMMLMIAEQNIGQTGYSYWWGNTTSTTSTNTVENTIIDILGKDGFKFVDPQVLSGKIKMKDAYQVTSAGVSADAAREIANLTDAQIVIVGTAVANDRGPIMEGNKMHSGQADVTVRAINTDNGEILLTSTTHGADAHINPSTAGTKALVKAAKLLTDDVKSKLVDKWLASSATVTLEVEGIANYMMLDGFKQALEEEISGVKGVFERKMQKEKAQLDMYYEGKTSTLAKELTLKTFKGFKVRVDEVTANRLVVTLQKTGK